jgi:S-adenosylmethionine synthetase
MVSGPLFFLSEPQWGTAVYDRCLFTSESVTEGHPDKVADAISDAVLDALLEKDPASRVACETLVTTGLAVIAGEITTNAYVHLPEVVRSTIARIGYTDAGFGFDSHTCAVMSTIDRQSSDIAMGVDTGGAGDQGMMFGYATDETDEMMPMPIMLAHRITRALADRRRNDKGFKWLRPDGKAQVTVLYEDNIPIAVDTFGTSTVAEAQIMKAVRDTFDLTPRGITAALDLRKPIYSATAAYGHFGRTPEKIGNGRGSATTFTWERTDRAAALKRAARG